MDGVEGGVSRGSIAFWWDAVMGALDPLSGAIVVFSTSLVVVLGRGEDGDD